MGWRVVGSPRSDTGDVVLTETTSHSAHLLLKTDDIQADGPKPRVYVVKADSGNDMERAWCDGCGAGIWIKQLNSPEKTNLKAGNYVTPEELRFSRDYDNLKLIVQTLGLFEPGDIPNPTMENWLKNIEEWETPAKGTKRTSQVN